MFVMPTLRGTSSVVAAAVPPPVKWKEICQMLQTLRHQKNDERVKFVVRQTVDHCNKYLYRIMLPGFHLIMLNCISNDFFLIAIYFFV
mmetsp:Transcript_20558/g.36124  ORF Transcript_20558/g.36124 Transcript_20558/m.36124 type:complete len:88 (+) Transcript_20558:643-906(+)